MVLLHGFIFSFPLQLLFLISVTSASGNENFLTSKHFLEFVQRFSACNVVKNILELFEANAVFENRTNALNISHVCYHDLEFTARALANGERWALQMLDSSGKPGSAILKKQLKWLGSYDECVDTKGQYSLKNASSDGRTELTGKYCKVSLFLVSTNVEEPGIMTPTNPAIERGICVPDSCSSADTEGLLATDVTYNPTVIKHVHVACDEEKRREGGSVVVICILSVLCLLIAVATTYDVIKFHLLRSSIHPTADSEGNSQEKVGVINEDCLAHVNEVETVFVNGGFVIDAEQSKHGSEGTEETVSSATSDSSKRDNPPRGISEKLLLSFSVLTNGKKIFSAQENADRFAVLHGIKFLSMSWIILGHSYLFVYQYAENVYSYTLDEGSMLSFMPISLTSIAVDTFFAVSGLLVTYLNLVEMKRVGGVRNFNWLVFFIHRFWRLTPTYMAMLMIFTTLMKHWSTGPFSVDGEDMFDNCKESWWTNLLYVNNLVKLDKMCMGWTWYLANDMQFYILSPLILVPLFYHRVLGIGLCLAFLIINIISVAVIVTGYDFHAQEVFRAVPWLDDGEYSKRVYMPCYTRVGPYVVGLLTGYLLYIQNFKCRLPKIVVLFMWLVSIILCMLVVYGPYHSHGDHVLTEGASVAYEALNRIGWSAAVCWIIFACVTGNGGWINSVLSWKPLVPLGRLTFCAYLIHPILMLTFYRNSQVPVHLSNVEMISIFLSNHVLSYGVAFIVSLCIESPMLAIEKILMRRRKEK